MNARHLRVNGLSLHVVEDGPADGPLVLLLHGFPEFSHGWRRQVPALAAAGYRVVAPDQRGYHLSDKPEGISAYCLDTLANDVVGLIDQYGRDRAAVVGHDWGGIVGWWLALRHADRLERLAILNAPHPQAMRRQLRRDAAQRRRSWYFLFFQLPWLPERVARRRDWEMLAGALVRTSRPGTFTDADLAAYRRAWSRPGACTAMLNWYRALLQRPPRRPRSPVVEVPTLLLWGSRDAFLVRDLATASLELCRRGELVFFDEATHWLHLEEAEAVNRRLLAFLSASPSTASSAIS